MAAKTKNGVIYINPEREKLEELVAQTVRSHTFNKKWDRAKQAILQAIEAEATPYGLGEEPLDTNAFEFDNPHIMGM